MAPEAIAKLSEITVYTFGKQKQAVLDKLEKDIPISLMPAQALKKAQKLTVFNDHKGEAI